MSPVNTLPSSDQNIKFDATSSNEAMKVDVISSNQNTKIDAISSNHNIKVDDKQMNKHSHVGAAAVDSDKDREHDSSCEDCSCKSCIDAYAIAFSHNHSINSDPLFHKKGSYRVIQKLDQDSKPKDTALERTTKQVCESESEKKSS
ncbi:MAG: hypothetical protein Q9213_002246 [Squamulea squamosa]